MFDEGYAGAIYRDLLFYYGKDITELLKEEPDGLTPRQAFALIEGLPDDSMFVALHMGGLEYLGWSQDRQMLASIFDGVRDLTVASGNWSKGKTPKFPRWPRPWDKKKKKTPDGARQKVTVKDLFAKFGMAGKR